MSTDFNAVFALGGEFRGAEWLRDALAAEPRAIAEACARYRHRWIPQTWTLERRQGLDAVTGPGGFTVTLTANAAELYHCVRWSTFTSDDEDRRVVRRACRSVAVMLGSPRAIYAHEMLPHGFYNGATFDGIEAVLRATVGAPSPTFDALAAAELFGPGCWYIDDFANVAAGV